MPGKPGTVRSYSVEGLWQVSGKHCRQRLARKGTPSFRTVSKKHLSIKSLSSNVRTAKIQGSCPAGAQGVCEPGWRGHPMGCKTNGAFYPDCNPEGGEAQAAERRAGQASTARLLLLLALSPRTQLMILSADLSVCNCATLAAHLALASRFWGTHIMARTGKAPRCCWATPRPAR